MKQGLSLAYGGEKPPVPGAKEVDSAKRRLSSSIVSIGKRREKPPRVVKATRKTGYAELKQRDGHRLDGHEVAMVGRTMETAKVEEMENIKS